MSWLNSLATHAYNANKRETETTHAQYKGRRRHHWFVIRGGKTDSFAKSSQESSDSYALLEE